MLLMYYIALRATSYSPYEVMFGRKSTLYLMDFADVPDSTTYYYLICKYINYLF